MFKILFFLAGCAWFCTYQHTSRYRVPAILPPQARPAVRQQHVASRFSATCTILLAKIGQGCASAWHCRDVPWRVSTWCVIKRHVSTMPCPYARNPIQFPLPPFPIFSCRQSSSISAKVGRAPCRTSSITTLRTMLSISPPEKLNFVANVRQSSSGSHSNLLFLHCSA